MKTILTDDVNVDGGLKLKVCIITEFYTYLLLNYEFKKKRFKFMFLLD